MRKLYSILIFLSLILSACSSKSDEPQEISKAVTPVKVTTINFRAPITDTYSPLSFQKSGKIDHKLKSVIVAENSGYLTNVNFKSGDKVKAGSSLGVLKLNKNEQVNLKSIAYLEQQIFNLEQNINILISNSYYQDINNYYAVDTQNFTLYNANQNYNDTLKTINESEEEINKDLELRQLQNSIVTTQNQISTLMNQSHINGNNTVSSINQLKNQVLQLRSQVNSLSASADKSIRALIPGTILKVYANKNDYLNPNSKVALVADLSSQIIKLELSAEEISKLENYEITANGVKLNLLEKDLMVNPSNGLIQVSFKPNNPLDALMNQTIELKFTENYTPKPSLYTTVPIKALIKSSNGFLAGVKRNGKLEFAKVSLAKVENGFASIKSGLLENDLTVIEAARLEEGTLIN